MAHQVPLCEECIEDHEGHGIKALTNIGSIKLKEYSDIVNVLKDEHRRLKEKIRVKKSMRNFVTYQMNQFFKACEFEIRKCREEYFTELQKQHVIFEQECELVEKNVQEILQQANLDEYCIENIQK